MASKADIQIPSSHANIPLAQVTVVSLPAVVHSYFRTAQADVTMQLETLGLDNYQAQHFLNACEPLLLDIVSRLDTRAFITANPAEQASMLLVRFDVDRFARAMGEERALLQSAIAVLVLDFICYAALQHRNIH